MYSDLLLDHFRNPRNVGELPAPAVTVEVVNPACGDILRLSAVFVEERVLQVLYKVRGCTASIAAGSALTEWMQSKTRGELGGLQASDIEALVGGLPTASQHAAALCVDGVRKLIR
jgi:nitrogen fixation NifU-like protein